MAANENKEVIHENLDRIDAGAVAVNDEASNRIVNQFDDELDNDDSIFKWLIPLILLGILIVLGYWFCGKSSAPTVPSNTIKNMNMNTNKTNVMTNTN